MAYALPPAADLKANLTGNEIVKGLIPAELSAKCMPTAGGGKTAIIVDLLLHVAAGIKYRGRRVERQPAIYVALEGHGGIENRIIAAARELGIDDAPFALIKATDNFRDPETARKLPDRGRTDEALRWRQPGDRDRHLHRGARAGGSDCDPKDVSAFIAAIQQHLLRHAR